MIWEQRGDRYFAREESWDYMVQKTMGRWSKWQKHTDDKRWSQVGTYASLEEAQGRGELME